MAELFRQTRHHPHLIGRGIPRRLPMRLQADRDNPIAGCPMRRDIGVDPRPEHRILRISRLKPVQRRFAETGCREHPLDLGQKLLIGAGKGRPDLGKPRLNQTADLVDPVLMDGDLDSRLVFVVPSTDLIPDRNDGLEIGQKIRLRQKLGDDLANHGGPTQATTNDHLEPGLPIPFDHTESNVMGPGHRAIVWASSDRNFELSRHELKLGMVGRPLPDQFSHRPRIGNLIRGSSCKMIRRHVPDRVAGGLGRMEPNFGQRIQHIRHIAQLRPIVLNVLPRGEMAVSPVPFLSQKRQL